MKRYAWTLSAAALYANLPIAEFVQKAGGEDMGVAQLISIRVVVSDIVKSSPNGRNLSVQVDFVGTEIETIFFEVLVDTEVVLQCVPKRTGLERTLVDYRQIAGNVPRSRRAARGPEQILGGFAGPENPYVRERILR